MENFLQILLVEDDEDDVDLLKVALQDNGIPFALDVIASGDQVIPWLEDCKTQPDIIVLDLNLPKMPGKDVLKALKGNDNFKSIPVMIHTTSSLQSDIDACMDAGADRYVSKACTIAGFRRVTETMVALAALSNA